jgi:hypothetical protein
VALRAVGSELSEINRDCSTVHIVHLPNGDAGALYAQRRLHMVNASGQPVTKANAVAAGNVVVVSGYLALTHDPAELKLLQNRLQQRVSGIGALNEVHATGFEVWVFNGGKVVAHEGPSITAQKAIAFQATVGQPASENLDVFSVYSWEETVVPMAAKLEMEWNSIIKRMQEAQGNSVLREDQLREFVAKIALEIVALQVPGGAATEENAKATERLAEILRSQLEQFVLSIEPEKHEASVAPTEKVSPGVSYRLKQKVDSTKLARTIDLSITTRLQHRESARGVLRY